MNLKTTLNSLSLLLLFTTSAANKSEDQESIAQEHLGQSNSQTALSHAINTDNLERQLTKNFQLSSLRERSYLTKSNPTKSSQVKTNQVKPSLVKLGNETESVLISDNVDNVDNVDNKTIKDKRITANTINIAQHRFYPAYNYAINPTKENVTAAKTVTTTVQHTFKQTIAISDVDQNHNTYALVENSALDNPLSIIQMNESTNVELAYDTSDFDQVHDIYPMVEYLTTDKQMPLLLQSPLPQTVNSSKTVNTTHIGYWQTVHSIESKQGKLLFRPRNKSRNCNHTKGPCGHHQLTVSALKDIGCVSLQCRKDRLDYKKSLSLSKKLLALNEQRLRKNGISNLDEYLTYLIHQQGANGIKNIIDANRGNKTLSKKIKKNMANNSPYSYKQYKKMSSKTAAYTFLKHWENKWESEKRLIVAMQTSAKPKSRFNPDFIPRFNEDELKLALNMKF